MEINQRWNLIQRPQQLPTYIPLIGNGASRSEALQVPFVALTTFDVLSPDSEYEYTGPEDLRRRFKISDSAKIVLISIGQDNRLERFWESKKSKDIPDRLAKLGISAITAPNFSFPLDVPRPEHLVNMRRSLVAAERFASAGLNVVPHLNAFNQRDWEAWKDFLRDHSQICMVSQEFQTGLANWKKAAWHIEHIDDLQQTLGRGLHLLAVGGRRHLPLLLRLSGITIVDSVPFVRACKRRQLQSGNGKWMVCRTPIGQPIDTILRINVQNYTETVQQLVGALRSGVWEVPAKGPVPSMNQQNFSPEQIRLWPDEQLEERMAASSVGSPTEASTATTPVAS